MSSSPCVCSDGRQTCNVKSRWRNRMSASGRIADPPSPLLRHCHLCSATLHHGRCLYIGENFTVVALPFCIVETTAMVANVGLASTRHHRLRFRGCARRCHGQHKTLTPPMAVPTPALDANDVYHPKMYEPEDEEQTNLPLQQEWIDAFFDTHPLPCLDRDI
ncbi:hypothetical protein Sjap_020390 [Stephania japonica]|uniref:Uncharacterized protein n=1 Tax=Stephania japonica TaxID=461633 RepID=A0AAP0F1X8_9MAGN